MRPVSDQSVVEQVANELRDAIHSAELLPGDRLIERKLVTRLGVSHIPIREALTRLEQEGLIVREPHRGARVAELTTADLEEISSLRIVLEQFIVERVQERWNESAAERLDAIVAAMSQVESGDVAGMLRHDRRFHEALAELADNRILMEVSGQLRGRIAGFLWAANAALEPGDQEEHVRSHQLIVEAIASGDRDQAREVIRAHVSTAAERLSARQSATITPGIGSS